MVDVIKRDGSKEALDVNKIHRVLEWATEGLTGVSISDIEIRANIQLFDGIRADDIHELLIKSAAELISETTPNYQHVAARLISYKLRKEVYGQFEPIALGDLLKKNVELGVYHPELLEFYSEEELERLDSFIKHERDHTIAYAGMEQFRGKYLCQDRSTGRIFETPQMLYMLVSMTLFSAYPTKTRLSWIKRYYDAISTFKISLPTPIMSGARTNDKQFSSCVLIESDDTIDSIIATGGSIVKYVTKKAGIGVGAGRIRVEGSKVGQGTTVHTGIVPFLRKFRGDLKSCSQGGVRGGSATVNYQWFRSDFDDLVVLKNNKGTFETRIRDLDYVVHLNGFFYQRVLDEKDVALFNPQDVPDLYDAFYSDQAEFARLYEQYENDDSVFRITVSAEEMYKKILTERQETGRLYIFNADNVNNHSAFNVPVRMTNLCVEINLPTKPLNDLHDPEGEIALCTLSAINFGLITEPSDFEKVCELAVRGLDALLDYQDYPVAAARNATMKRRPLGIGIINFAYFLAKRGLKYNKKALKTIHEYVEAWSYYLIKASMELAKEKGSPCPGWNETKYSEGLFPIDTYKKDVDDLVKPRYYMDWEWLKEQVAEHGLANSTLMALMPSETSSQIADATNGIEPPPELVVKKVSKHGKLAQVVPEIQKLKNVYDLRWDQKPTDYLMVAAVLQKFIDQAGSFNTSHNPEKYRRGKIPLSVLGRDIMFAYKYGLNTLYYAVPFATKDENEIMADDEPEIDEEDCDSCVL